MGQATDITYGDTQQWWTLFPEFIEKFREIDDEIQSAIRTSTEAADEKITKVIVERITKALGQKDKGDKAPKVGAHRNGETFRAIHAPSDLARRTRAASS